MFTNYCNNYGWSKRGTPLINFKKTHPVKYSILMAISNNKIISYEFHKTIITKNGKIRKIESPKNIFN